MTPTLSELLTGCFVAFSQPVPPESAGEFMAGRIGIVGLTNLLAAQEAERGPATRVWENGALRALLHEVTPAYGARLGQLADQALAETDGDGSLSALDAANVVLRRALIALHEAVETAGDVDLDRRILGLYREMAERHRLDLPPMPAG